MAADALRAVRILAILASLGCIFVPLRLLYSQQRAGFSSAHQYQTRPGSLIPDIATLKPNSTPYKAIELGLELVVASLKSENTSWVHEYLPDWPASIYVVDDPDAPLTVPKNKGNEAMVYLTHLIDRYDTLASSTVFVHAQRFAWHNDGPNYDALVTLQHIQTPYVQASGYVNLRCALFPGCPAAVRPNQDAGKMTPLTNIFKPAFQQILPGIPVPEVVAATCCAQFAVSRETVHSRSREDYVRLREWLLNTELDDSLSGRVFEYTWHIIFGKAAVYCPDAGECYCKVFGIRCRRS